MNTHVVHMLASHVKHVERTFSTCGLQGPHVAGHVLHMTRRAAVHVFHMLFGVPDDVFRRRNGP